MVTVVIAAMINLLPTPDAGAKVETHCVVVVIDQLESGEFVMSSPVCFDTLLEAEAWSSSAEALELAVTNPGIGNSSLPASLSTFTLGQHFDGFNGQGSSISVIGGNCTGGWWNTGTGWANKISSSYNGCTRLRHWDLPNKGGDVEDTTGTGTTKNLTHMNNRTESVSYHPS